ncbi:MAG TPA: hypothetical protein VNQ73_13705 [Ilumatobacter sp.]|nr:hypothetical protein [Ilumatobacter sp.]
MTDELDLSLLYEPITIRNMTLRNRFVMPAMQRCWSENGQPVAFLADYYRKRAAGGTSLIITESCAVDHPSATQVPYYSWISDATAQGWQRCAEAVRSEGAHFFVQLWHEGSIRTVGGDGPLSHHPTLSPSGLVDADRVNGRAATLDELDEIKDAFVRGAKIAQQIGASGVEVHACHGYFLDLFLWKDTNRRTDGYGGDELADRLRYPAEIVRAIRAAVGDDFVVSFRFSQWKEVDYQAQVVENPAELEQLVRTIEDAGADMLHVSVRRFWLPEWPELDPQLGLAGWTKKFATVPVVAVGSVGLDVDVMDNMLGHEAKQTGLASFVELERRFKAGEFDLMSVGRGQIGDPDWVTKVRDGDIFGIRQFTREDLMRDIEVPDLVTDAHR